MTSNPASEPVREAADVLRRLRAAIDSGELDASPAVAAGLNGAAEAFEQAEPVQQTTD